MSNVPHDLDYDSKIQRLKRRYQGLSRVAAAINDLYIYGVYPSNFPNLTTVLEQAKDHCKEIIKETKKEIAKVLLTNNKPHIRQTIDTGNVVKDNE